MRGTEYADHLTAAGDKQINQRVECSFRGRIRNPDISDWSAPFACEKTACIALAREGGDACETPARDNRGHGK